MLVFACRCYSWVFSAFRAGELSAAELENMMVIVANPRQFKIPDWFLNRQKDIKDGRFSQAVSNGLDTKMRDDLERLKKIRCVPQRQLFCRVRFVLTFGKPTDGSCHGICCLGFRNNSSRLFVVAS